MSCTHEDRAAALCVHMDADEDVEAALLRFTGRGVEYRLLCAACASLDDPPLVPVCSACSAARELWIERFEGRPDVAERPSTLAFERRELGVGLAPVEVAPLPGGDWLCLLGDELRSLSGASLPLAAAFDTVRVSRDGRFAAVASRRGRTGAVVDLRSGRTTMSLDRGGYRIEHHDFALAFFDDAGRPLLVHATAWNRLDLFDPADGRLLSGGRSLDGLDYFHAGLSVSPGARWLVDDGWAWHPAGILRCIDLQAFRHEGVERARSLRQIAYAWGVPLCFADEDTLLVWGFGRDDLTLVPAVELYDLASGERRRWFAGPPRQRFVVDDGLLVAGGTVWDVTTGERLLDDPRVEPVGFHPETREHLAVEEGRLVAYRLVGR